MNKKEIKEYEKIYKKYDGKYGDLVQEHIKILHDLDQLTKKYNKKANDQHINDNIIECQTRIKEIKQLTTNQAIIEHVNNMALALNDILGTIIKHIVIRDWGGLYEDIHLFNTRADAEDWVKQDILKEYDSEEEYKEALDSRCGKNMYEYYYDQIEIEV